MENKLETSITEQNVNIVKSNDDQLAPDTTYVNCLNGGTPRSYTLDTRGNSVETDSENKVMEGSVVTVVDPPLKVDVTSSSYTEAVAVGTYNTISIDQNPLLTKHMNAVAPGETQANDELAPSESISETKRTPSTSDTDADLPPSTPAAAEELDPKSVDPTLSVFDEVGQNSENALLQNTETLRAESETDKIIDSSCEVFKSDVSQSGMSEVLGKPNQIGITEKPDLLELTMSGDVLGHSISREDGQTSPNNQSELKGIEIKVFKDLSASGLPREEASKIQNFQAKMEKTGSPKNKVGGLVKARHRLAVGAKKMRHLKFTKFTRYQKLLHCKLRKEGISHVSAVDKVLEVTDKIGINNIKTVLTKTFVGEYPGSCLLVSLEKLLSSECGAGKSSSTNLPFSAAVATSSMDVPILEGDGILNPLSGIDVTDNKSGVGERPEHYEKYGEFIFSLQRHPKCEHSLDDIVQMAEQVPAARGVYGKELFILRCFQFGVDPNAWDWSQYSQVPTAPKVFSQSIPPCKSLKKRETSSECRQLSCTHASCKYFTASGAAQGGSSLKHKQQSSREASNNSSIVNVRITNSQFKSCSTGSSSYTKCNNLDYRTPEPKQRHPHSIASSHNQRVNMERFKYEESCMDSADSEPSKSPVTYNQHMEDESNPKINEPPTRYQSAGSGPELVTSSLSKCSLRLYIVSSQYPRELLDEETMYEIENSILEAALKIHGERIRPTFDGLIHNNGRCEVKCRDQFTKEWLHKYISCMNHQWTTSIKIMPAESSVGGASRVASLSYDNAEDERGPHPSVLSVSHSGTHDSHHQGCCRPPSVGPYQHNQFTKRNVQDRLGPAIPDIGWSRSSPAPLEDLRLQVAMRSPSIEYMVATEQGDDMDSSRSRSNSPYCRDEGERLRYVRICSPNQEQSDKSQSPDYSHSRRISISQHDNENNRSSSRSPRRWDYGMHSRYVQQEQFDESWSPNHCHHQAIEPSLSQEMDNRLLWRSSPISRGYGESSDHVEPYSHGKAYAERHVLPYVSRHSRRSLRPTHSQSRYYPSMEQDQYLGEHSRTDARELLRQLRFNRQ